MSTLAMSHLKSTNTRSLSSREQRERRLTAGTPLPGERSERDGVSVELFSSSRLPTLYGDFDVYVFRTSVDAYEHVALVRGEVRAKDTLTRVHSECLTGDVLGSLRCDCREQLHQAMADIGQSEAGILLYMRQEGRGIGLGNKVRAYALQEQGLDTFEANVHLGFDEDLRRYDVAAQIIAMFAPASLRLMTNNPRKVFGLRAAGVEVAERLPIVAKPTPHNRPYLQAKANRAGHLLPFD